VEGTGFNLGGGPANVDVVTELDRDRFWTLLPASVGS
jgi:hypothetical protein